MIEQNTYEACLYCIEQSIQGNQDFFVINLECSEKDTVTAVISAAAEAGFAVYIIGEQISDRPLSNKVWTVTTLEFQARPIDLDAIIF